MLIMHDNKSRKYLAEKFFDLMKTPPSDEEIDAFSKKMEKAAAKWDNMGPFSSDGPFAALMEAQDASPQND